MNATIIKSQYILDLSIWGKKITARKKNKAHEIRTVIV
jgi:hypothetical protein